VPPSRSHRGRAERTRTAGASAREIEALRPVDDRGRRPRLDGTLRHPPQRIDVRFDFPLVFTRDALSPANPTLAQVLARREPERRHRVVFVIDGGVQAAMPDVAERALAYAAHHRRSIEAAGEPLVVPGGEVAKNEPRHLDAILRRLHDERVDRHAFVVAVGGGAVLDLAGYAAAITHRGVRIVRLPSTTLAQADAGVGVKNGVNAFGKKNYLGTFAPPFGVVCDLALLDRLADRDRRAGLAEVVKVAVIREPELFEQLARRERALLEGDRDALELAVRRGAELHLQHIATSGDPFELGSARPLDFGHWAAHKLEAMSGHRLRHGEAVAIGIALDVRYAADASLLPSHVAERIVGLLGGLGFTLWAPELEERDARGRPRVLDGLEEFREHLGGRLAITLPTGLGRSIEASAVNEARVTRCLEALAREHGPTSRTRPSAPPPPAEPTAAGRAAGGAA
jgi:3-dehydroquinate synthase